VRIAFFGTPAFAVSTLGALLASRHEVAVVVTQPDRPTGRGQRVRPGPVKSLAVDHGVPVLQPERMRDESFVSALTSLALDLAIVAAYGRILPPALLAIPARGMLNVHASLLPRWRGAAPVHRAVMAGDRVTGITIMRVVAALDAGPMLARASIEIGPDETSAELEPRLADLGARLLVDTLDRLERSDVAEEPQDEAQVTYAHRLDRAESDVDWARPAAQIHNQIRGLQPWPLAAVRLQGRRLLLLRSTVASEAPVDAAPGVVLEARQDGLLVAAAPGAIGLLAVQPEGRPPMSIRDFLNGRRVEPGARLERLDGR
jgi:methionyl-tRNA formyltransferase